MLGEAAGQRRDELAQAVEGGDARLDRLLLELARDGLDDARHLGLQQRARARDDALDRHRVCRARLDERDGGHLLQQVVEGGEDVHLDVLLALLEARDQHRRNLGEELAELVGPADDDGREQLGRGAAHLPRDVVVVRVLRVVLLLLHVLLLLLHVLVLVGVGVVGVVRDVLQRHARDLLLEDGHVLGAAQHEGVEGLQARLAHLGVAARLGGRALLQHERHYELELLAQPVAARAADGRERLDVRAPQVGGDALVVHLRDDARDQLRRRGGAEVRRCWQCGGAAVRRCGGAAAPERGRGGGSGVAEGGGNGGRQQRGRRRRRRRRLRRRQRRRRLRRALERTWPSSLSGSAAESEAMHAMARLRAAARAEPSSLKRAVRQASDSSSLRWPPKRLSRSLRMSMLSSFTSSVSLATPVG